MKDEEIEQIINGKPEQEEDMEIVKYHVGELRKRFDTVRIFCTRDKPNAGGTASATWGAGNWFAQWGQIALWAEQEKREENV